MSTQTKPGQGADVTWHMMATDSWDFLLSEAVIFVLGCADFHNTVVILSRVILD